MTFRSYLLRWQPKDELPEPQSTYCIAVCLRKKLLVPKQIVMLYNNFWEIISKILSKGRPVSIHKKDQSIQVQSRQCLV